MKNNSTPYTTGFTVLDKISIIFYFKKNTDDWEFHYFIMRLQKKLDEADYIWIFSKFISFNWVAKFNNWRFLQIFLSDKKQFFIMDFDKTNAIESADNFMSNFASKWFLRIYQTSSFDKKFFMGHKKNLLSMFPLNPLISDIFAK